MRAGKLDKSIIIERFTDAVDDFGTPTQAWSEVLASHAQLIQSTTDEFLKSFGADAETVAIFRIRWRDGITTDDRVTYAGKAYDLKEIKELGRREALELRCVATKA